MRKLLATALLGLASQCAFAQTASIRGLITDPSGASLVGAKVTLKNTQKGWTRAVMADQDGSYTFTQIAPEVYSLSVEAAGFTAEERSGIVLQVNQDARLDFALKVGSTSDRVVVMAESPLIQSENASTGAVVDEQKIKELPLNGREFWQLAQVSPMVFTPPQGSSLGFRGGFNVAGNAEVTNQFVMDGIDNNDQTTGQPTHRPSVDGIQEFKVLTGVYSAEYGRQSGGQVIVTTKSGSNEIHGTAYYFHRNDNLDARNFFLRGPTPELKRHQYGGSGGGPIWKNKTFYFGTYEALKLGEGVARLRTVPTALMGRGDLSELNRVIRDPQNNQPFPGAQIPSSRLHPTSQKFLRFWPQTNQPGSINNYSFSGVRTQDQKQFSTRLDHRFSDKDSLYFSYQFSRRENIEPSNALCGDRGLPLFSCTEPERTQTGSLVHTHVFTPALLNEARIGFNRIRTNRFQDDRALGNLVKELGLPQGGPQGLAGPEFENTGLPQLRVTGYATLGGPTNLPQGRAVTNYNLVNTTTWIRGGHTIRMGFDLKRYIFNSWLTQFGRGDFFFNGQFTGDPMGDFLIGGLRQTQRQPGEPFNNLYNFALAAFVQDDWVVSRRLTLNLGLRYDFFQPVLERVDKNASFDVNTGNIVTSDGRALNVVNGRLAEVGRSPLDRYMWRPDKNNFAPRFGFAYRLDNDNRTVLRGGYGWFYNMVILGNGISTMYRGLPFRFAETVVNSPTAVLATWENPFPVTSGGGLNPQGINPDFRDAYIQQWSLGVQRQLSKNLVLDTTYLGSKGTRLPINFDYNQPEPGPGAIAGRRPFRQWGTANYRESVGASTFHALSARLEHRFASGLSALVSYTYSKSIDLGAGLASSGDGETGVLNPRNLSAERGRSEFDTRHRAIISLVYELPFGKGRTFAGNANRFLDSLIGGWEVTGIILLQTGRPFTVFTARDMSNTGNTANRPNVVGNWRPAQQTPANWIERAAFSDVLPANTFAYGNLGTNTFDGDSINTFDLGFFKRFTLTERVRFQLRAELFNAFNHANFAFPDNNLQSTGFGTISRTNTLNRQIQIGGKLVF
jgi:hypothetical protein